MSKYALFFALYFQLDSIVSLLIKDNFLWQYKSNEKNFQWHIFFFFSLSVNAPDQSVCLSIVLVFQLIDLYNETVKFFWHLIENRWATTKKIGHLNSSIWVAHQSKRISSEVEFLLWFTRSIDATHNDRFHLHSFFISINATLFMYA